MLLGKLEIVQLDNRPNKRNLELTIAKTPKHGIGSSIQLFVSGCTWTISQNSFSSSSCLFAWILPLTRYVNV